MSSFALDLSKAIEKAKEQQELISKRLMIDLFTSVILKSPVGNKETWKANSSAMYMRETHNLFVDRFNEDLFSNQENLTKSGNLKRGIKKAKRLSKIGLLDTFSLPAGKDYVGGRFRANWVVNYGSIDETITNDIDKSGAKTIAKAAEKVGAYKFEDGSVWLSNSLPYSVRLENGWSQQAPVGMVRISLIDIQNTYGA